MSSCILLIVGGFTLPVRPDMVMTENEYKEFLVKTPPFHCIIAGIILFAAGIALQLYGISKKHVVPHTDRINELAHQPTPHVRFDIV
jgi:p-aminobenzoyl-glutamate transporter AbgT